jgi:acetolactate synthase-1/2/3 large subunit
VISEAFRIATQGRPGPVLIDLTKDAQQAHVPPSAFPTAEAPELTASSASAHTPVDAAIDDVVALLRQAERPVIIAGYGVLLAQAQRALQQLLQVVPCPVVHTLPGKAALPTAHPCNYGMLGMHGFYVSNWIVHHADLVVSLGSRYDDRITGDPQRFAPAAKRLVHFDIDPEQIAKVLPGRKLGVVGDLKAALVALQRRLESAPLAFPRWRQAITEIVRQYPSTYARRPEWLQAQYALEVLNDVVQQQVAQTGQPVTYTTEVGDHQMWAGQHVALQDGWQFITSSGQGAMGSGLPMAIGAQLAHPASLVICLAGDGSLRFSEAELETIWEYDLPVKTLVFNNDGYGIVRMWNHRFYEGRETGVIKRHKDWSLLARGNGFDADCVDRVTEPADLAPVLQRALSHRHPHFIELVTPYEECLPLMPPGQSFNEMIL